MNPSVSFVQPDPDYTLSIAFASGEWTRFDVKPYLDKGILCELRDPRAFSRVRSVLGRASSGPGGRTCVLTRSTRKANPRLNSLAAMTWNAVFVCLSAVSAALPARRANPLRIVDALGEVSGADVASGR